MTATAALLWAAPPARGQLVAEEDSFSHRGQIGFNLQGGFGYRATFPYGEEFCGQRAADGSNKPNCLGRSPFALDLGVSYGVLDLLELFVELRVGLERDFGERPGDSGPRVLVLAPGIKGYIAEVGQLRLFSTLQVPIDFTGYGQFSKVDLGVRNVNGFQLDVHRTTGIYFYVGETASFRRWLRFEIEGGLGMQARFP